MKTEYEPAQAEFSQAAHAAARRELYPAMFGTPDLRYSNVAERTSEAARVLDGKLGIDVIVWPKTPEGLSSRLPYYVQERFRRPEYEHYGDVTITEYNHASGIPSELYKLGADLVVYGLYDLPEDHFVNACAIDALRVKALLRNGNLRYAKQENRKQQTFLCFSLLDLREAGCIAWETIKGAEQLGPPDDVLDSSLADWYLQNDGWLPEELRGSA